MPAVIVRKWADMRAEYETECRRLADAAIARYCQDIYNPLYLAGTKRAGLDTLNPRAAIWCRLDVLSEVQIDTSAVFMTACGESIPRHMDSDQLKDWIMGKLNSEPLWIFAD